VRAVVDVLSDVLTVTRVGRVAVAHAELVPPWALAVDPIAEAHVHVVRRGRCFLRASADAAARPLAAGDVVLIRSGVGHSLASDPELRPEPYRDVLAAMPSRLARLAPAHAHTTTSVLCAKYLFSPSGPHPLTGLPPFIHLTAHEAAAHVELSLLIQLLEHEAEHTKRGAELVLPRLVDSLLVYVIRAWLAAQPRDAGGWFGALREPAIAKALALIHEQPTAPWTVESLAERVAQSRASFARRFHELVGEPPVAYLTRWRMCLGAKLLADSELGLDAIAARVGYESAAAFAKAFRRSHGAPPGCAPRSTCPATRRSSSAAWPRACSCWWAASSLSSEAPSWSTGSRAQSWTRASRKTHS
jgi:AraC-like DNA-binding protein